MKVAGKATENSEASELRSSMAPRESMPDSMSGSCGPISQSALSSSSTIADAMRSRRDSISARGAILPTAVAAAAAAAAAADTVALEEPVVAVVEEGIATTSEYISAVTSTMFLAAKVFQENALAVKLAGDSLVDALQANTAL